MTVGPVHHLLVIVSSLEEAGKFYGEALGMRRTLRMELQGPDFEKLLRVPAGSRANVWYFDGGSRQGQLELMAWVEQPEGDGIAAPNRGGVAGLGVSMLCFHVTDEALEDVYARVHGAGYPCWTEPFTMKLPNYGEIRAFVAEDPDGNRVEFLELPTDDEVRAFRARSADQSRVGRASSCGSG